MLSPELVAEYHLLLSQTQELLAFRHEKQWVSMLQSWRRELTSVTADADLRRHAVRTARALGGIGSISEIALAGGDESFTKLLEALYATCRQIRIGHLLQNRHYTH